MDGSYPEAGWAGFFKRLLYEGYEKAAYVWQSTGSDASEPKLSLAPLIWGSVKAAVFALLFATPIALAAAMYLSQIAAPAWRARLKPAVEMLAAVPSVVIGFIAALWLAPHLERFLRFFVWNHHYDQRNSLVIAVAMGFAVTPTVFSLAEDAISAVPHSLSAASLALGASKWQTVLRVVLPTASPGIFTAVMLGFGRAVGETMIVLMAAGNTPIISLSPFNGMRTLSANIAVEMPEAPVGGTLYRTLFLCALILFVLTLVINTAAEVFRHRLRNRYGKV
jgi:phosphate transport system permease protein